MNRTELQSLVLEHMTKEQVSSEFGDRRLKATWQAAYDYIIAKDKQAQQTEPCYTDNQPETSSNLSAITLLKTATAIVKEECDDLPVVLYHCFVVWFILCYVFFYRCVPITQQTRSVFSLIHQTYCVLIHQVSKHHRRGIPVT
jgi:hypothetical protein